MLAVTREIEMAFKTTDANGFHMAFANGATVSVQWNPGNYVSDRSGGRGDRRDSADAEVAAWWPDGTWINLGDNDDVVGWQTTENVCEIMRMVSQMEQPQ